MNSSSGHSWIWSYAAVAGLLAFVCSRGSDGLPVLAFFGFSILGVVYCSRMWSSQRASFATAFKHLIIVEFMVIVALAIDPGLEEMGGMLYELIPPYVAGFIVIGWIAQLFHRRPVEEPVPRCPKCNYVLIGLSTPRCPECGTTFSDIAKDSEP